MELNRNHYFLAGLLVFLIGMQFRLVDSFVLNEKTTRFLADRTQSSDEFAMRNFFPTAMPIPRKTVRPPQWLGYSLISVGSVLMLHALGMKKPGG